jgi:predicted nuclease of restriction endonuclease-like (RecB) superfamily
LEVEFGRGFGEKNLRRMVQFAETFPDAEIVAALLRQLGWTHFTLLIPMQDALKRDFYAEMLRVGRRSTRAPRQKIDGMLYERTALSRKPDQLIRRELDKPRAEDALTPDLVLQDPYLLDFLGLKDTYSEKDLESALLREIEGFLLELGAGFRRGPGMRSATRRTRPGRKRGAAVTPPRPALRGNCRLPTARSRPSRSKSGSRESSRW